MLAYSQTMASVEGFFAADPGGRRPIAREFAELASLVADSSVTDIFLNGAGATWLDRGGGLEPHPEVSLNEVETRARWETYR
jgi:hypothetical protein